MKKETIKKAYEIAKQQYAEIGVNTEKALEALSKISISLHCWQGDDVSGFERAGSELSGGGIQVTGNYPGKARTIAELRKDLEKAYSLIPGNHRLNLHSIYGDFGGKYVERDKYEPKHFKSWVEWAKGEKIKLDFNCTCFSHPLADSGYTVSSKDKNVREFWIEHVKKVRAISAYMGKEQDSPCVHNFWIPDGEKDIPADRISHREILKDSLDQIFKIKYPESQLKDALESKLFGIGSESYVVGSHEFYMGYALKNKKMICLDLGHFHPTESIADKISSLLLFSDELLLHVSRGVRWDSDHVVILNDDLKALMQEIIRSNALDKVNIALDFFDASINRLGAWAIGTRASLQALLLALLEPVKTLKGYEDKGNNFARLAFSENMKAMPFGAVWNYYCEKNNVPTGDTMITEIMDYEKKVQSKR